MKRANLLSALLLAVATPCAWGQPYYDTPSAQSQNPVLAQALIGTWAPYENSSYSGYAATSEKLTFYPNGTYEHTTMTIVSMGDYSNDGEETESGIWELQGNVLYMFSYTTGQQVVAELQMNRPEAFYANGELWIKQSSW
jgi:hypothetical protein